MSPLLRQIADHHLLHGLSCLEMGLWEGKMGMSLFFFLLSRHTGNRWYEEFAGELLDDVCGGLSTHHPVTLSDGLCGIGWGIEYLKKHGFIEGNTDDILQEVDRQVMERDVRRTTDTSLETGLAGIAAYVRSRLDSEREVPTFRPFDDRYLQDLDEACRRANLPWRTEAYNLSAVWQKVLALLPQLEPHAWQRGLTLLNEKHE